MRSLQQAVANPTYLEFFGLTQPPFAQLDDPCQLFHTEQYSLLMEHLDNASANADSLVVICGADGSGKSSLLDHFSTSMDPDAFCVVIDETCQDEGQFYTAFLTQIGFDDISGTVDELRNITKEFLVCRGVAGDHVLILFDSAHLTDPRILMQLRWLCEIKIKDRRVLSVVLAGNADLVRVVDAPAMRKTKFRNHVVFSIRAYTEEETANYVWHRLRLAGGDAGVKVPQESYARIHRYSGGIPHLINDLCHATLAEAHAQKTRVVTEKIVRIVADKQQLLPHVIPLHGKGRRSTDPDFQHLQAVPDAEERDLTVGSQTNESTENYLHESPDVDPGNLLQQIARLSEQVDDLRADKMRAVLDIEARNGDIVELRDELGLQSGKVDELKRSLAVNADEIARQHLALSNSTEALRDSENRSNQLASDLESEIQARQAVENELAKATASVADLSQLKQDLQNTVNDLQIEHEASLKLADKRAAATEALEKTAADYKHELEREDGELDALRDELDSRDLELADLEIRLNESQKECELAELRITGLKDPKELQKIKRTSNRRAADLRKQTRARKTAEKESAGLKAELEAKTDELGSLKSELDSLRGELESRNLELADLEIRLKESQKECELAELRISGLKDPKELQKIKKTSNQRAADLRKQTRARKTAEKELAEVAATVEELSQLKQELKETVSELKTDLEAADERAAEFGTVVKELAGLKAGLDGKTDELESLRGELRVRNEIHADLEIRLDRSQSACELAQLRIVELKSPKELEEIEKASEQLATDLENERRARESAENELAKAAATVDELNQLKLELRPTVDDLQADLETQLEESRAECESAQRRIAALKDPEELDELKRAADKLAADLEKEHLARESAENELTKATATVDELKQLKQELQSTVDDLQVDLEAGFKLAGETAVEIAALDSNAADLEAEIKSKDGELEVKNQAVADLEKRLVASQKECELLRGRTPVVSFDEVSGPIEAGTASRRNVGVKSSGLVARFERSIRNVSAYQSLRDYDLDLYDGLVTKYKTLVGQGLSDKQVNDALRSEQAELIGRLLPRASNEAIIDYARLTIDQLDEFQLDGVEPCLTLLVPQRNPDDDSSPAYSESTKKRELDLLDLTLKSYHAFRPIPAEEDVWPDLELIFTELFQAFGADNVAAMQNSYDPIIDRVLVCNVSRALYSGILNIPKVKAANALRWLLST